MSVLVIGGDKICNIKEKLREKGFDTIEHVSGRKKSDKKIRISGKTDLVLVLIDYVGHRIVDVIKEESKRCDTKVMFSKRSWVDIEKSIQPFIKGIEC